MFDKAIFNILNVVIYAGCTYFIARIARPSLNLWLWALVSISFWLLMPIPGSTLFWLTGSVNYLWAACINAFVLYAFLHAKKVPLLIMLPISILAGNAHETFSIALAVTLFCILMFRRRNKNTYYLLLGGYVVGLLLNVLAPGNYVRLGVSVEAESINFAIAAFSKLYLNLKKFLFFILETKELGMLFSFFTFLTSLTMFAWLLFSNKKKKAFIVGAFLLGTCSSLVLNIVSGCIYERALYGFCFMTYIMFIVSISLTIPKRLFKYCGVAAMCLLAFINARELPKANYAVHAMKTTLSEVKNESLKGNHFIHLPDEFKKASGRYTEIYGLGSNVIENRPLAQYHGGVDYIIPDAKLNQFLQDNLDSLETLPVNEIKFFQNDYHALRLKCFPIQVKGMLPCIEMPFRLSFVRAYSKCIPRGFSTIVFYYKSSHYIIWQNSEPGGRIIVKTKEGESLTFDETLP